MEKFQTKKSLGQHFLSSNVVPVWLCDAGDVKEGDTVLEVGPGTGVLTAEILARGAKVVALEADSRAIEVLESKFTSQLTTGQLYIYHTDVRKLDLEKLDLADKSFKVVANIPYYLTGHLFRSFLDSTIQPTLLVFLIQKEVAKRATAKLSRDEKESLLSLSLKVFGTPTYIRTVGRGHFVPPPAVDSAIIKIDDISQNNFLNISSNDFFEILHLGFGQKRKQLLGNLSKKYDRKILLEIFPTIGIAEDARAEDIPLEKWLLLVTELQ